MRHPSEQLATGPRRPVVDPDAEFRSLFGATVSRVLQSFLTIWS